MADDGYLGKTVGSMFNMMIRVWFGVFGRSVRKSHRANTSRKFFFSVLFILAHKISD